MAKNSEDKPEIKKDEDESHCLITVGTTEFNHLIVNIDDNCDKLLNVLSEKGINCLTIQKGKGKYKPEKIITRNNKLSLMKYINIVQYLSGQEFGKLMRNSSLVISHAGAGSILESLRMGKKLFVVNNDTLMHNHQLEICRPLAKDKYLYFSPNVKQFIDILSKSDYTKLVEYPPADYNAFPNLLNNEMGI